MEKKYYVLNPATPISNKVLFCGLSLLLVIIGGFVHGILSAVNPLVYFAFLISVGFGIYLGLGFRIVSKIAKIRDKKFILITGVILSLFAIYASWVSFLNFFVLEGENLVDAYYGEGFLFFHPDVLFEIVYDAYKMGLWTIGTTVIKGSPLLIAWLLEIGIIIFMCVKYIRDYEIAPFSDRQNKWYKKYILFDEYQSLPNEDSFLDLDGRSVLEKIENLSSGKSLRFGRISIFYLENTTQNYLYYENVDRDRKGKKETATIIIPGLKISKEEAKLILDKKHGKKEFFLNY